MDTKAIIRVKTAYRIGFSSSLSPSSWSAYNELSKWNLEGKRLQNSFLNGFRDGTKAIQEVRGEQRDFLGAIVKSADEA